MDILKFPYGRFIVWCYNTINYINKLILTLSKFSISHSHYVRLCVLLTLFLAPTSPFWEKLSVPLIDHPKARPPQSELQILEDAIASDPNSECSGPDKEVLEIPEDPEYRVL